MQGDIYICSSNPNGHDQVPLHSFEPDHAEETLGVYLAMDGNNMAEIEKLLGKSKEFAECLRTGKMTRPDAWYAFHSTLMKMLEYPMAATTII